MNLEDVKKAVYEGRCKTYNSWHNLTGMKPETFIEALEWAFHDPLDDQGRPKREIGLNGDGSYEKLYRTYKAGSFWANYQVSDNHLWSGSSFKFEPRSATEKMFAEKDGFIHQTQNFRFTSRSVEVEFVPKLVCPLTDWMSRKGMNKRQLAERSGVPYSTIHDLTTGKKKLGNMTFENISKIASALDMSLEDFEMAAHQQKREEQVAAETIERFKKQAEIINERERKSC